MTSTANIDAIDQARALIKDAEHICVFTGAGMSAESGIPTFRDALSGLWAHHRPEDLATPEGWSRDPELVWSWYRDRAERLQSVQPNRGHEAIARLGSEKTETGGRVSIVTQNVDDLHQRAGSTVDAHLHGNLLGPRCEMCPYRAPAAQSLAAGLQPCPNCGSRLRPDVVWFGEHLPEHPWHIASQLMQTCDLLMIIGTSGVVHPAAGLPSLAADAGTPIIEINPEPSALTELATVHLPSRAADCLPQLI